MAVKEKCVFWIFVLIQGFVLNSNAQAAKALKVGSVPDSSYLSKKDGQYVGYMPDLMGFMSDKLGVNITLTESSDGKYGSVSSTGEWSGLMKDVIDDTVDIVGPLTLMFTRMNAVPFTYPIMCVGPTIVMQRPESNRPPLKESLTRLLHPMEFPVWLMTVLSFIVTGTVLYIISHFNPYEWRRMAKDKEATIREAESFTCLNSFWFVISSLAWQGYVRAPRSMGGRITVTAWWFFVIIFILSYTASLTNYLRVGPDPYEAEGYSKIKSFQDLADNDDVMVGVVSSGSTESYFANSKEYVNKRIYEKITASRSKLNYTALADGVQFLRDREYADTALIMESVAAKVFVNQKPCDLYMISDHTVTSYTAFAVKNSTILKKFNEALLQLQETGVLNSLEQKWFKSQCTQTEYDLAKKDEKYEEPTFYQLDLGTFSGALLILTCGILLGGIVSLVEYCIYKFAEAPADEGEEATKPSQNPNRQSTASEPDQNEQLLPSASRSGATQV